MKSRKRKIHQNQYSKLRNKFRKKILISSKNGVSLATTTCLTNTLKDCKEKARDQPEALLQGKIQSINPSWKSTAGSNSREGQNPTAFRTSEPSVS